MLLFYSVFKWNLIVLDKQIRNLMPESKFTREFFAVFTTVFFRWLVGPSEVRFEVLNNFRKHIYVIFISFSD